MTCSAHCPLLALVSAAVLASCSSPRVEGVVQSPSGGGIGDVTVAIEGSAFSTTTGGNGGYSLEYAPGSFTLSFRKPGYTSAELQLSLSEKTRFPAEPITLYPMPATPGVYYLLEDELVSLDQRPIIRTDQVGAMQSRHQFSVSTESLPMLRAGEIIFVDATNETMQLAAVNSDGLVYDVAYQFMTGRPIYQEYVEDATEEVGLEKLRLRRVNLAAGRYAWIQLGRGPIIASEGPRGSSFPFVVR